MIWPYGRPRWYHALARPHVLQVVEIKKSGVALLEGSDAARIEEQQKNIAHCPLPILNTKLYLERFYRGPSLYCRVCGRRNRATKMVLCDACNHGYHIWCLDEPLLRVPEEAWKTSRHSGMVHTQLITGIGEVLCHEPFNHNKVGEIPLRSFTL